MSVSYASPKGRCLFLTDDVEVQFYAVGVTGTRSHEQAGVQPQPALRRRFEAWMRAEIQAVGINVFAACKGGDIFGRTRANAGVFYVNALTVGRFDDVARMDLGAGGGNDGLVIGAAGQNTPVNLRAAYGSAQQGNDSAPAKRCVAHLFGGAHLHVQLGQVFEGGRGLGSAHGVVLLASIAGSKPAMRL